MSGGRTLKMILAVDEVVNFEASAKEIGNVREVRKWSMRDVAVQLQSATVEDRCSLAPRSRRLEQQRQNSIDRETGQPNCLVKKTT